MGRVLLSVSDKTGLALVAQRLAARGHHLISTGGTARALIDTGVPVMKVADITGFPEMMDGRVKTLHPAVHAGILARRSRPDDLESLQAAGFDPIDVVIVNLYPFAEAAARIETPVDALVEEIDIGGPTLIRAAAKSFQDVLVVVDPGDYDDLITQIDRSDGPTSEFRLALARKAFAHTAAYDRMIAATFRGIDAGPDGFTRRPASEAALERQFWLHGARRETLRYGENPHQGAAWYRNEGDPGGFGDVVVHQGKGLSYTNLLDLDAACRIAMEFDEPAAAVIKHTNPCGVAVGRSASAAYTRARDADALSAFGGIVGLNRTIDIETATAIVSTFIEAVVAPDVSEAAIRILSGKPNLRVVTADFSRFGDQTTAGHDVRSILGGLLVQTRDLVSEGRQVWSDGSSHLDVPTKRHPTEEEWAGLRFAWRVCGHVKSNAVIFTSSDRTLAIGAGQMSRVDAVNVAVMKAADGLRGSIAASDAFFPFRDGLDAVARAGATAVVQPGGSKRDAEVIAAADDHGLAMVLTSRRHFRH